MISAAHVTVTVVVDGARVDGSQPARRCAGAIVAPFAPYARDLARTVEVDLERGRFVFRRDGRTVVVRAVGAACAGSEAGEPVVPLGAVARGLGATVDYDARSRTLSIALPPEPVGPFVAEPGPSAAPLATFTPQPAVTPRPTVSGIPRPRRTPVLVEPEP